MDGLVYHIVSYWNIVNVVRPVVNMSVPTKNIFKSLLFSYIIITAFNLNNCLCDQKVMKPDILRQILLKVSNSSTVNNEKQINKNENLTGSESILNIFDTNWRPQFLLSDHNNKLDIQINNIPNQQSNTQQFLPESSSLTMMEPNSLVLSGQPELLLNFQPQMFPQSTFSPTYSLDEFTSFGLPSLDMSNDWKFDKPKNDCTDSKQISDSDHQRQTFPCSAPSDDNKPIRSNEPDKVDKCLEKESDDYPNDVSDDEDNNDDTNDNHHDDKEEENTDDDNPLPYDPFEYLNRHRKSIQSNKEINDGSQNYIEELPDTAPNPEKIEENDNHDTNNGKDISSDNTQPESSETNDSNANETSESPSNVQEKEEQEPESEPEPDKEPDADPEDLRDDFDNQFDTQTATKNEPRGESDSDEPPSDEEDDDRDDDDDDDRDNDESFPIPSIEKVPKEMKPLRRTRRNIAMSSFSEQKPKNLKFSKNIDFMPVYPNFYPPSLSQPSLQSMLMESDHSPMKEFDDETRYHSKPYPHFHTYYRKRRKQKHENNYPSNMQQIDPYTNDDEYWRQTFYRPKKHLRTTKPRNSHHYHNHHTLPFVYTNLDDHLADLKPNKLPLWSWSDFSNTMNEPFYPQIFTPNHLFLPSNDFGSSTFMGNPYLHKPRYLPASVSFGDPFNDFNPHIPDYHNHNYEEDNIHHNNYDHGHDDDQNSTPEDYIDDGKQGNGDLTGNDDVAAATIPPSIPDYEDHENQPLGDYQYDPNDDDTTSGNQNTLTSPANTEYENDGHQTIVNDVNDDAQLVHQRINDGQHKRRVKNIRNNKKKSGLRY